jgi:hypothetical protein
MTLANPRQRPRPGRGRDRPRTRTIDPDDPISAQGQTHWTEGLSQNEWSVRTETFTTLRSDAENFHMTGRIEPYEREKLVFARDFEEKIAREHI